MPKKTKINGKKRTIMNLKIGHYIAIIAFVVAGTYGVRTYMRGGGGGYMSPSRIEGTSDQAAVNSLHDIKNTIEENLNRCGRILDNIKVHSISDDKNLHAILESDPKDSSEIKLLKDDFRKKFEIMNDVLHETADFVNQNITTMHNTISQKIDALRAEQNQK